ncbi:hypothetical protein [Nocardia sp. bgisy118]|uniref:hypothetical protein n=1 Tax=Nocardia sp. bgisy118 TaxID=3413786 RepID=UPI003F4A3BDE
MRIGLCRREFGDGAQPPAAFVVHGRPVRAVSWRDNGYLGDGAHGPAVFVAHGGAVAVVSWRGGCGIIL